MNKSTAKTRRRTALSALAIASTALLAAACSSETPASPDAATSESPAAVTSAAVPPAEETALTCGGAGTDGSAQIRYQSEIMIDAPLSTVWNLHTDVQSWPTWQQPVTSMNSAGPLAAGSQFQWTTPAPATATTPATTLTITSTVHELEPDSCVRWSGPAVGDGLSIDNGTHVWNFSEVDGGVLVKTEETWTGAQVEADVPTSTMFLGAGLDAWLAEMKTTAEAQS
nr:SRPBCC family protein [Rhodococcus sp. (in: high G+C Gram-positive bacteria)]